MSFQIRVGSLIVVARSAQDAVKLFDRLSVDTRDAARAEVHDMVGRPVKIDDLRLIAASGQ
jgi:hypothetical protein